MSRPPSRHPVAPPAAERLLLLAAYSALTVWWLWPLPTVWRTHSAYFYEDYRPAVADFYLILWALAWDCHALVTAPWRLFDANAFYPAALSLAYSEHFLGYVPLFAPTYWVTGNPILALNVLVFATYPLCAIAMYALARRWMDPPAAAVAGYFYAFSLFRYWMPPHVHQLGVQWLPLTLLFTERWLEGARARDAVWLGAVLLLQALSSFYLAYALAIAYGTYLALALWRWRRSLDQRRLLGIALAAGVTAGVLGVTAVPYLTLRRLGLIPSYGDGGEVFVGLVPYFAAIPVREYLRGRGVGPVGYALAVIALLPWQARRWPRLVGVILAVVGTVAAFGPGIWVAGRLVPWSPYRLLMEWVPGFSSVRAPSRFLVITQLGVALLAGLGLGRLLQRLRPRLAYPAAVVTAAAALASFGPFPQLPLHAEIASDAVPSVYRWLAAHGAGRALLELPAGDSVASAQRMYMSTYHWLPIVDGYSAYPPASARYLQGIAAGLPAPSSLQQLVDAADIGWILVHRDRLPEPRRIAWEGTLPAGLERAGLWGDDLLLRVALPPRDDRRARLASATETPEGTPLVALASCPGTIRLAVPPPSPWVPQAPATIVAEIENDGPAAWPAFSYYPRHLVRLTARLTTRDGQPVGRAGKIPLPRDVPPRGMVRVPVPLTAPSAPGAYELEVALIQVLDGPLARCGVEPLRQLVSVSAAAR